MLFADPSGLHRPRLHTFTDQKARPLIKTQHRIVRVIRQGIQRSQLFHAGQETTGELAQTPGALEMRL